MPLDRQQPAEKAPCLQREPFSLRLIKAADERLRADVFTYEILLITFRDGEPRLINRLADAPNWRDVVCIDQPRMFLPYLDRRKEVATALLAEWVDVLLARGCAPTVEQVDDLASEVPLLRTLPTEIINDILGEARDALAEAAEEAAALTRCELIRAG